MAYWQRRTNHEPFFWLGSCPVFVTELLIIAHVIAFVIVAVSTPAGFSNWISDQLYFRSSDVMGHGKVWQLISYPFAPDVAFPYAINMVMLFWFGRELESHLGRMGFVLLYVCLAVCPMLILTALNSVLPSSYNGADILHFSLFLAFASLFPETEMFLGRLQAKWVALTFFTLYVLIFLSRMQYSQMLMLIVSSVMATFAVRAPFFSSFIDYIETHHERQAEEKARKTIQRIEQERQVHERTIDSILDKISQQGLHSLTKEERAALERARMNLLKKEKR